MSLFKESKDLEKAYGLINEAGPVKKKVAPVAAEPDTTLAKQAASMADKIKAEPKLPILQPKVDLSNLSWGDPVNDAADRDMPEMTMDDYKRAILRTVRLRGSLLVYGDPGIGKTHTVYKMAPGIARDSFGREFIAYSDLLNINGGKGSEIVKADKLQDLLDHPEKYFVLIEVQAQTLEPVDLSGLYDIRAKSPYISTKIQLWAYLATLPGAAGILFFDEFNMAPVEVQNAFMKVTHPKERLIGSYRIGKDFSVLAAGNLTLESGRTALDSAQTNRFDCGFIVLDPEAWLQWAHEENISDSIIMYVRSGTEYTSSGESTGKNPTLYSPQRESNSPFPTPRSIALFDETLKDIIKNHEHELSQAIENGVPGPTEKQLIRDIVMAAKMKCGSYWGAGFALFMKACMEFEIDAIVKDPKKYYEEDDMSKLNQLIFFLMKHVKSMTAKKAIGGQEDEHDKAVGLAVAYGMMHLSREMTKVFFDMLLRDLPREQFIQLLEYLNTSVPFKDPKQQAELKQRIKDVGAFIKGKI